jgi:hypothetical protein
MAFSYATAISFSRSFLPRSTANPGGYGSRNGGLVALHMMARGTPDVRKWPRMLHHEPSGGAVDLVTTKTIMSGFGRSALARYFEIEREAQ